jgi:olefin beta-lactone synthetase
MVNPPANLVSLLDEFASSYPDQNALLCPTTHRQFFPHTAQEITFSELYRRVNAIAHIFQHNGISKGDRVVVMVPVSVDLYLTLLALMKLAATAVLIEPSMGLSQIDRCCRATHPKAFVGSPRAHVLRLLSPALRAAPLSFVVGMRNLPGTKSLVVPAQGEHPRVSTEIPAEDCPAVITFTTGNTGRPKAMGRTHKFLWQQHLAVGEAFSFLPGDVELTTFLLFVLDNLASRVPTLLLPYPASGLKPADVVRWIGEFGVTTLKSSPFFFQVIARHCEATGAVLPGVRAILTGGAPVRPTLVQALQRLLPNGEVYVAYGSTEVEPISIIRGQEIIDETGMLTGTGHGYCVGQPLTSLDVGFVSLKRQHPRQEGLRIESATLPQGESGEIAVSGIHVNETYFQDPQAVAETKIQASDGRIWHRTGDTGYIDDKGRLWLTGRVANLVVRGGAVICPLQVEAVVDTLPFVERCALLGVPDRDLGDKAVLVIALKNRRLHWLSPGSRQLLRRDIMALCRTQNLAIDEVVFKRNIPIDRHRRGKIQYDKLRSWYRRPSLLRAFL